MYDLFDFVRKVVEGDSASSTECIHIADDGVVGEGEFVSVEIEFEEGDGTLPDDGGVFVA